MTLDIGALRRSAGLTQKALAAELGVHPNTLAQWERGARQPKSDRMEAVSAICRSRASNGDSGGASAPSIGARDALYNKIRDGLPKFRGSADLFEACCADLLHDAWPTLVPVLGGGDSGFDGVAHMSGQPAPIPLIVTTSQDPKRNLASNLAAAKKLHPKLCKAIFATSKRLTARGRRKLHDAAADADVQLLQVYDMEALALLLYRNSRWRKDLLGLTGSAPALSPIPASPRPWAGGLVGRAADLDWIMTNRGDRVIAGAPGSGKTTLLQELARQGHAVFMVDGRRDLLADAIRDMRPRRVVVDDAHVRPDWLDGLIQVREEVGEDFDIIATCWPTDSDIDGINRTLDRTKNGADLSLQPLADGDIREVVRGAGVHGPIPLLRSILQQAKGRPGLAVTLARACLSDGVNTAISGDALLRSLGAALEQRLKPSIRQKLAAFAVGGESGMSIKAVAKRWNEPASDLRTELACLHDAGVVSPTRFSAADEIVVEPPQLRWQLVRQAFFGAVPSLDDLRHFMQFARQEREAIRTLIGAYACGAATALPLLRDYMERHENDIDLWAEFAGTRGEAARLALEKHPHRMDKLADPALEVAPNEALRLIFEDADGKPIPPHRLDSGADDAFAWVRRWTSAQRHTRRAWVRRRSALMDEAEQWGKEAGHQRTAVAFMCVAMLPCLDGHEMEPGSGGGVTFWSGALPVQDLRVIAGWWGRLRDAIGESAKKPDDCPWNAIMGLVAHWTPKGIGRPRTKDQAELMTTTVERMLKDLAPVTDGRPAWRSDLLERAEVAGVTISMPSSDSDFDTLYPVMTLSTESGDLIEHLNELDGCARALGKEWVGRPIDEVADMLERTEREAARAYATGRRNYVQGFCHEVASHGALDKGEAVSLLVERGLSTDAVSVFLEAAVEQRRTGWRDAVAKCLANPRYAHLAVYAVLTMPQPPRDMLRNTMRVAGVYPTAVEAACIRGLVARETLRALLKTQESDLAMPAAVGHWLADPRGEVDESVGDEWRNVIMSTASLAEIPVHSNMEHWVGEILANTPRLAEDWLGRRFHAHPSPASCLLEDVEESAARGLALEQRIRMMRNLGQSENGSELDSHLQQWVTALVGDDLDAFKALLDVPGLRQCRLAPLMRFDEPDAVWRRFASAALAVGESARNVALWSFGGGRVGCFVPNTSPFAREREIFLSLLDDSDDMIAAIARQGVVAYTSKE